MLETTSQPGCAWLEAVSRPTLQAFSLAFSADPTLEATVLAMPLRGAGDIYDFFLTTRSMYGHISFMQEMRSITRTCLEWEGLFQGKELSGATILTFDAHGAIEHVRLYHYPLHQLNAFAAELARRLASDRAVAVNHRDAPQTQSIRQRAVAPFEVISTNRDHGNE